MSEHEKAARVRGLATDALGLAGLGSLGVGLWMVYPPAMLIVVGVLALAAAVLRERSTGTEESES